METANVIYVILMVCLIFVGVFAMVCLDIIYWDPNFLRIHIALKWGLFLAVNIIALAVFLSMAIQAYQNIIKD